MVKILAWTFALLNIAPILWMIWSSLMGSSEIQQGNLFPNPYPNDVYFFQKIRNEGLVVGTLHGQIYRFPKGVLDDKNRESLDLSAVSVQYAASDTTLYAFSPDEALMQVNLDRMKIDRRWKWAAFKKSFIASDFSKFQVVSNQIPLKEFQSLATLLDSVPMISGRNMTLSSLYGLSFPMDSSVIDVLNSLISSKKSLSMALNIWSKEKNWANPVIAKLFAKRYRTTIENRELFRWCLAERVPTPLTRFRKVPWRSIWVDRIPASDHGVSIAQVGNYLCIGLWWEPFPGIAIVNENESSDDIRWITVQDGLPSSSVQKILRISDSEILVAHDLGFSLIDVNENKVKANYLYGESGLPFYNGRDLRISLVGRSAMLFSYGREIVFFDFRAGRALKRVFGDSRLFHSDITALKSDPDRIYFGSSDGISELYLWDLLSEEMESKRTFSKFMAPKDGSGKKVNGVVSSIFTANGKLFVGGLGGQLAVIDENSGKTEESLNLPSGGFYLHWRNYEDLWRTIPFKTFLMNSLIICLSTVFICIIFASFAGYALARLHFYGRNSLNVVLIWSQVVPNILYLIPAFLLFSYLQLHTSIHLLNTKTGIILLYSALFVPMATWILRNFFRSVPPELEEAALMDGCSPLKAFFRIVIPSAMPGIIATAIYIFILSWDELMFVWVLSMDSTTATIPVGMRLLVGQFGNRFDLLMAAATISTLPVMILFFVMQRQLLFGISNGTNSVKVLPKMSKTTGALR
ncbi:MAG: carbohydrate ABC transporter permease [Fibrobacteraceae bacterium]|nr:carbohydrate ABC transporter permease [Fibrobacteraceae bacterium]